MLAENSSLGTPLQLLFFLIVNGIYIFCSRVKRKESDQHKLSITFTATEKTEIGISNVSFPDMYRGR